MQILSCIDMRTNKLDGFELKILALFFLVKSIGGRPC